MRNWNKTQWLYLFAGLFIAIACVGIALEHFEVLLIPVVLLIVYLAFFHLDTLYLFLLFLVPLSVNLDDIGMGVGMTLPTDPILFGLLLLVIIKSLYLESFNTNILKHPVSIIIYIQLAWVFISSLTSTMPVISFKYLTAQLWYFATFYFIATHVFLKIRNIKKFFWLYVLPFSIVITYTLVRHASFNFDQHPGNWVMKPFYNDHTSYGAALALFIPFLIGITFNYNKKEALFKPLYFFILLYFIVATIFSYTRAAWLSLAVGLMVYIILKFKIRWQILFVGFISLCIAGLVMQNEIEHYFSKNKVNSSTEIDQHVKSMSNVSSDASNKERINRWKSGFEMFKERPIFGWGPGTYSFNYGKFQKASDKTIISTNAGDGGNAHSEFVGPMSESGILGILIVFVFFITILITAVRVYKRSTTQFFKNYSIFCVIGLVTYMIHGFLNNFLDTDKITAPFYGMTAIIVVMDLYQKNKITLQEDDLNA